MALAQNKKPRVAIVHDWLYGGGAEKVVEQLHILYPKAPIYASYCTEEWRKRLDGKVITGYLNNWPFDKLRKYLPLLRQWWFKHIDLKGYDLIISSSGNGEAKFITKPEGAIHINYCHTPPHFYWRKYESYLKNPGFGSFNWLARIGLRLFVRPLRKNDYKAAQKVDFFIANSTHIQNDIKTFYGRDSVVVPPPINTDKFNKITPKPAPGNPPKFIYWGRHVPDKRIDIVVQACTRLQLPLVVIGEGVETENLKKMAGTTVSFTGKVSDKVLVEYAAKADAFIFPSEEDFGIAPVEALAAGLPVIAYQAGGALDYIVNKKNGLFFDQQSVESLIQTLATFKPENFDPRLARESASYFSEKEFKSKIISFVNSVYK